VHAIVSQQSQSAAAGRGRLQYSHRTTVPVAKHARGRAEHDIRLRCGDRVFTSLIRPLGGSNRPFLASRLPILTLPVAGLAVRHFPVQAPSSAQEYRGTGLDGCELQVDF
jgi:hypothetical protein